MLSAPPSLGLLAHTQMIPICLITTLSRNFLESKVFYLVFTPNEPVSVLLCL